MKRLLCALLPALLLLPTAAAAQLRAERIENGRRVCEYEPASDPLDVTQHSDRAQDAADNAPRIVRFDLWQRCPNQYPRNGPNNEAAPPFATLVGQITREGRLYCQYRGGERTYEVSRGYSTVCNYTPGGW